MRPSQKADYLDSDSKAEATDMRNSNAFQIVDYEDPVDSRKTDENNRYDHDFVDLDLDLCYAYYHFHVGCIFNLYYFNNFDCSRYFYDCHFSGHFGDCYHHYVDDHLFI